MLQPIATATLAFAAGFAAAWFLRSPRMAANHRVCSKPRVAGTVPNHDDWIEGPLMPEAWYEERHCG